MKVILGTGQLGMAILETLLKNEPPEAITLVNRTGKLSRTLPANVQLLAANVADKHTMECIARDAEIIFSCTDVPYQFWKEFYPAAATALAYALGRTGAKLVFADNMYSYGNVAGAVMSESLAHKAKTRKGQIRASVLKTLLFSGDPFNTRVIVVKAADFIGPGIHKGLFGKDFLDRLYRGKPIMLFGEPQLPHAFTYIHDFAKAMVNMANAPDAFGQVWHAPNAAPMSCGDWVGLFEKASGKKAVIKRLPKLLVCLAGLFSPLTRELYELAYQFEFPYLVNDEKYAARFGNHAAGHQRIVKETLTWYERNTIIKK